MYFDNMFDNRQPPRPQLLRERTKPKKQKSKNKK